MTRTLPGQAAAFSPEDPIGFKQRALQWADGFDTVCVLESNGYPFDPYGAYEYIIAAGSANGLTVADSRGAFERIKRYHQTHRTWLFGFFSYDLKNDTEELASENEDGLGFPLAHFFEPQTIISKKKDGPLEISSKATAPLDIFTKISNFAPRRALRRKGAQLTQVGLLTRTGRSTYLDNVEAVQRHILAGDVYELNYCQEFYANDVEVDPLELFEQLTKVSAMPFSAYYKHENRCIICGSPERFLKKTGRRIIAQPMKGTTKRGRDAAEDAALREQLRENEKERAENVMIVDLVRNDLSKICTHGSVKVTELFGVYPFERVQQMVSTVEGQLRHGLHPVDAIKAAFPMGSMTGAPKPMSMHLIERYETRKRGAYSGALGYFSPNGDFDFNVLIRSIFYDKHKKYLSCQVGSAIVHDSVAQSEYEECLLKLESIALALANAHCIA
jgi:para-aminobenzoate synthetase component 1